MCCSLQEVDPTVEEEMGSTEGMDSLFSELANAIPGIDEAMSFAEMLKYDSSNNYMHFSIGFTISLILIFIQGHTWCDMLVVRF